jgi:hypothetical protein
MASMMKHANANKTGNEGPSGIKAGHQKRSLGTGPRHLHSSFNSTLPERLDGFPGEVLPEGVRERMESRLGYDLSTVRVHTGTEAAGAARELDARAFAFGSEIFFAAGEFAPSTPPGEHLLAHELAHVIQQSRVGAFPAAMSNQASLEGAADRAAGVLTSSDRGPVEVSGASGNWLAPNRGRARAMRRGTAGGVHFQEGPRDVIAIRLSNTSGDMAGILASIDAVMTTFGSAGRTYVRTLGFAAALESRLAELGHPAATGGGPRMSRDRWLTIRVRIVRGEGRRIEGLRLLPQVRVTEAPEGLTIEGEEPEPVLEVALEVEPPPRTERARPRGWRGWVQAIGEDLESAGDLVSGRWFWDPIMGQMAEWERDLAAIGETEGRTIEVSGTEAALIPIGIVFTVIHGILGTADLLARLNPYNVALQELSRRARALSGSYGRAELEQDLRASGAEAWGILTLGLGRAIDHMREGIRDANAFRTTQAVTEIVMAILAVIGLIAGVRSLSSSARMSAAVEAEAAAGVEAGAVEAATSGPTTTSDVATRPTEPGPGAVERATVPEPDLPYRETEAGPGAAERATVPEPDLPYRPTEPAAGATERATVPEPDLPYRPTEPGPGAAERATVPERGLAERPTEPGPAAEERATVPERGPTERPPTGPGGGLRVRRAVRDLAEARRLRDHLVGEAEGVELMPDHAYFADEYRALGGEGEVPYAYEQTNGRVVVDVSRTGWPSGEVMRAGAERTAARSAAAQPPVEAWSEGASGARAAPRRIDSLVEARRLQQAYARGERTGGHVNHIDPVELQRHWEASGGEGPAPPAWVDEAGHAAFDTRRVGHPPEGIELVGPGAARPGAAPEPMPDWVEGETPLAPRPGSERATEAGPPTLREPWRDLPDEALGRSTEPGHAPLRVPGQLSIRGVIRSLSEARRLMEQYVSGQRGGGYQLRPDHAWMVDEWHAFGRTGEPPPAFVQSDGVVVFDTSRLGWPSQEALNRGALRQAARAQAAQDARVAAEAARRAASAPRWARRIETPAEADIEIERLIDAGQGMRKLRVQANEEAYLAQWRAAGGGDPAPVAFFDEQGVLWINRRAVRGI